MSVEFQDFSIKVREALEEASIQFLEEAASELESQAKRNTVRGRVNGGDTIGRWKHVVEESKLEATIGNTSQNAIWEEFGTGEHALEGKGRKGGWYILIGEGEGQISQAVVDAYNMPVKYGKDGKKFAYTEGKKPKRMLYTAFEKNKAKIIRRARQIFKERLDGE